ALEHWIEEVRKLKEHLEQRFRLQITNEKLNAAIHLMNRERGLRRQLADLMAADPPPLTGRQLLEFKSIISGLGPDLEQYEKALQFFRQESSRPPQAHVRVLLTGVPIVHGAERVLELIEDCSAVCQENCTGLKPILEDVDAHDPDPIRAIARKYYHLPCSVMTINRGRFDSLRALTARFRPHCIIELVWQACLTYDVESHQVRKLAEEELRLPYLKIVTDYSPSDSARLRTRIEALLARTRSQWGLQL
ncbi:MAG: 2-hydroxyacyl-CoA dehydratase family protein, partial [Verrucomicrobia bacterium]|nr:2-hydroxyacyl-CoA dehydratase family protein [Verrucomicrobiota bacterium]